MGKVTPKHCPKCSSKNIHNQELEPEHDFEELICTAETANGAATFHPDYP